MTGGDKIIQVYSPLHDFHPHSVVLPALDKPRFLMHMTLLVGHGRLSASRLAQIKVNMYSFQKCDRGSVDTLSKNVYSLSQNRV